MISTKFTEVMLGKTQGIGERALCCPAWTRQKEICEEIWPYCDEGKVLEKDEGESMPKNLGLSGQTRVSKPNEINYGSRRSQLGMLEKCQIL